MTKTAYMLGILFSTIFGWAAWTVVFLRLSPYGTEKYLALSLFYVSLFFALAGTLSLIGYYLRVYLHRNEIYYSHISTSLRQGVFLSLFLCVCLVFLDYKVFTWWNAGLLFLAIALLEVYFLSRRG